jgi:hypothetical protein
MYILRYPNQSDLRGRPPQTPLRFAELFIRVKMKLLGSPLKCLIAGPQFNTYWIFDYYLIINFCQTDLRGPHSPPGAVIRMKLLRSLVKCRIFYFILLLQPQAITGIGGGSIATEHSTRVTQPLHFLRPYTDMGVAGSPND